MLLSIPKSIILPNVLFLVLSILSHYSKKFLLLPVNCFVCQISSYIPPYIRSDTPQMDSIEKGLRVAGI